jgi:hypothetical protein
MFRMIDSRILETHHYLFGIALNSIVDHIVVQILVRIQDVNPRD